MFGYKINTLCFNKNKQKYANKHFKQSNLLHMPQYKYNT